MQALDTAAIPASPSPLPLPPTPCSPSILLNPLFPPNRKQPSVLVTHTPSAPPPHWIAENPQHRSSSSSPPWANVDLHSRSTSANPDRRGRLEGSAEAPERVHCKFAPLPPGKPRSNSIAIGVAARASMLKGQGSSSAHSHPQYAGPQMWYQQGGQVPPDVYTYKDLQSAWSKLWTKVKRRPSTASRSSSSAESGVMERDGKGKSKEIQHIEEAEDEDEDGESDDEDQAIDDSDSEDEQQERRGRALGLVSLDSSASDASLASSSATSAASDEPRTPTDEHTPTGEGKEIRSRKGKEVDRRPRATTKALAL